MLLSKKGVAALLRPWFFDALARRSGSLLFFVSGIDMHLFNALMARAIPLIPRAIIQKISRRYIAGATLGEALARVQQLNAQGFCVTLDVCANQIRPWALGRSNWLFAGSLRSGKRAAAIASLIQSVRLSGHDPYAYLKDVLTRLPTQRGSEITKLLPRRWAPV